MATGCLTACAGSPEGEPALDPSIVAGADPHGVPAPLERYRLDEADVEVINRARELVGNECMRRFGFAPATGWAQPPFDAHAYTFWSRYGLWDPVSADTGYLPPAHFDEPRPRVPPFTGDAGRVHAGKVKEYRGRPVPEGGCAGQAHRVVAESWRAAEGIPNLVEKLDGEALERSLGDSRVLPLLDLWRECMSERGWDYEDVTSPFLHWSQASRRGTDKIVELGDITGDEKRSARDDIACKKSTGLLGTWLAADVAYQQEIVQRERERLDDYSEYWHKVLVNANRIVAGKVGV